MSQNILWRDDSSRVRHYPKVKSMAMTMLSLSPNIGLDESCGVWNPQNICLDLQGSFESVSKLLLHYFTSECHLIELFLRLTHLRLQFPQMGRLIGPYFTKKSPSWVSESILPKQVYFFNRQKWGGMHVLFEALGILFYFCAGLYYRFPNTKVLCLVKMLLMKNSYSWARTTKVKIILIPHGHRTVL